MDTSGSVGGMTTASKQRKLQEIRFSQGGVFEAPAVSFRFADVVSPSTYLFRRNAEIGKWSVVHQSQSWDRYESKEYATGRNPPNAASLTLFFHNDRRRR